MVSASPRPICLADVSALSCSNVDVPFDLRMHWANSDTDGSNAQGITFAKRHGRQDGMKEDIAFAPLWLDCT